ncbi:hypothetical protein M2347_003218 [Chryseobacterium sp. H1D6B]|uniref:hypothetical protein n=1 Tax=Chryseobacterium sp. H1D6B TaxID=2940588 RepID=UPI0015C85B87|nr:hypothetical protein [Chryseobacterium sp. H1D6B]MDH6253491.1 hypothetical protein [Chryseobacterium sp. H1D6B]
MKKKFLLLSAIAIAAAAHSQVGIGTANPNPSAVLDLSASNKAFILPRISLKSTTDIVTVPSPVKGMMVYQLINSGSGTAAVKADNIYKFNGTNWQQLVDNIGASKQVLSASAVPGQNLQLVNVAAVQLTNEKNDIFNAWDGTVFTIPTGEGGVYTVNFQSANLHAITGGSDNWFIIAKLQISTNGGTTWTDLTRDTRSGISLADRDNGNILFWSGSLQDGNKLRVAIYCSSTVPNTVDLASIVISKT